MPPTPLGRVAVGDIERALREDTQLVSLMHVNNETGVIQDVAAVGASAASVASRFHVDAAQSSGKVPLDVDSATIDLCSLTAHKIYGPKGVGALYVARRRRAQAADLRRRAGARHAPGTLATHQAVGMGQAYALAARERERPGSPRCATRLWSGCASIRRRQNGHPQRRAPVC